MISRSCPFLVYFLSGCSFLHHSPGFPPLLSVSFLFSLSFPITEAPALALREFLFQPAGLGEKRHTPASPCPSTVVVSSKQPVKLVVCATVSVLLCHCVTSAALSSLLITHVLCAVVVFALTSIFSTGHMSSVFYSKLTQLRQPIKSYANFFSQCMSTR